MKFLNNIFAAVVLAVAGPAIAAADHLLISEVLIDSPGTESDTLSAEFVEIYNPTPNTISLANYYLTDYKNYHKYPAGNFEWVDTADYLLQFPTTATLASGQVAVVTLTASHFLTQVGSSFGNTLSGYTSQPGSPLLFEIDGLHPDVTEMRNPKALAGAPKDISFAKTNGGEVLMLFHWDGETDLVQDVDGVRWGTVSAGNQFENKSGVAVDGPDADTDPSTYLTDAYISFLYNPSTIPVAMVRITATESEEVSSGGNGITGHDETTEVLENGFQSSTAAATTPGVPHSGLLAGVSEWSLF